MDDLYKILGVSRSSTTEEIKKAYRELAKGLHPDKEGGDEERMKDINEAYRVLGNEERRSQYDLLGQRAKEGNRSAPPQREGQSQQRTRTRTGDPFADLFGAGMDDIFAEYSRAMNMDLNDLFGAGFGARVKQEDPTFNIPENDWGLLNALQRAYEAKGDGEWSIKRVNADQRDYLPKEFYKVKRENGQVTIFRTIKDMRHEYRREKPIVVGESSYDKNKKEYSSTALFSEYYFTNEGSRKLTTDSVSIPSSFPEYLRALHSLARKFAKKEYAGKNAEGNGTFDVDAELRIINSYSNFSAYRYAEKGKQRKPDKELIEQVGFKDFFNRLGEAAREVTDISKGRGKEGGWQGGEKTKY
ncbi:hypothetical protein DYH11_03750 [Candidatus Microgenomates bacterium CPR3]|nr:hypothetical protein [Candidatus Microgenomates bacterium CPR3]